MSVRAFLDSLGPEIEDPEEESFLLFSQSIPSQNLGFVDQRATSIDLSINGRDLTIHQSPTILSSTRSGGTTGAVVWKVTPRFATWVTSPQNPLIKDGLLNQNTSVLELGCGISGIIGLALGPSVRQYVLTDQEYVLKLLRQNLEENRVATGSSASKGRSSGKQGKKSYAPALTTTNVIAQALDWETDEISNVVVNEESFDVVIACDCIYNDALIAPLVSTCVEACKLRQVAAASDAGLEPAMCIVGQQLRSDEVFEGWLKEFHKSFHVWRIPDEVLTDDLKENSGFVLHIGILR